MPFTSLYNRLLRLGRSLLPEPEKEESMPSVQRLSFQDIVNDLQWMRQEHHREYLAMYSSWFGGILRDPPFMLLPVDDHMVHRGDGVFEAMKLLPGGIYLLERHLDRLERSAGMISLPWPVERDELREIVLETARAAETERGCLRLFLSRGPGDFSPSPAGSVGSQLYIVVTTLPSPSRDALELGCSLRTSRVPMKSGLFAKVKSCNYLPNALMAQEARDMGVDFAISRDEEGYLGEGATENFGMVTGEDELVVPSFRRVLDGTTAVRVMELARELLAKGQLRGVEERRVRVEDFLEAKEVFAVGTTVDLLPVVQFEGERIGDGLPGPWCRRLLELLHRDMERDSEALTPVEKGPEGKV
jgi:branched-chain amino acid aminotransferase